MKGTPVTTHVPGCPTRTGTIQGESKNKRCWIIVYDGNSQNSRNAINKTFITIR